MLSIHGLSVGASGSGGSPGSSGTGPDLSLSPAYSQSGVVGGINYAVRGWFSASQAYVEVDVIGTAASSINVQLASITPPQIPSPDDRSLFLPIFEYTDGNEIQGQSIVGALRINRLGDVWLSIRQDAVITSGSTETKTYRVGN